MRDVIVWGGAIGGFALSLFILERFFPLRRAKRPLSGRLMVNLTFAAIVCPSGVSGWTPTTLRSFPSGIGCTVPWGSMFRKRRSTPAERDTPRTADNLNGEK
jgi:hypothetical protein